MGVELLKMGVKMRKGVICTMRGCFRSVCNHPFLVLLLSVLIYMYRSSPYMFSLLVYASPVLVCTAVLLGTLLFFGQYNVPEIEVDEKTAHESVALKTQVSRDSIVVENVKKNESCFVERFSEKRGYAGEEPGVGPGLSKSEVDEVCREGSVDIAAKLNKERSRESELENDEILEAKRELENDRIEKQKCESNDERLSDGEVMENHYTSIQKASDVESEYEKSEADSYDSERLNVDALESSAWKQVEQREDEEEDDDGLDSGSDQAESSSPDASMADMIPMLDELHPLLDEDGAQPVQISRAGSNEPSSPSSTSSTESVDETDNQEDDIDNDDDDDDAQGDKEDHRKAAITWTEEDQKNLMDLGCSEIERNQRLENLLMRRKTRKNVSMVPEIDLIDLESSEFPIHVAPISTMRQNPFDLPHDSYDNSGLPPIPGSAPSILLPRRNPFDIPYESTEENSDQMGDGLEEESKTRDPFFRRRDSFNVGPSIFSPNRQDLKWRPYFVPERAVLEESSYSTLQQQSNEMSDKAESESSSSAEEMGDQKLEEEDGPHEVIEEGALVDQDRVSKRGSSEEDEPEVISMKHESQSSEGEECMELGTGKRRAIDHVEDHYEEENVAIPNSSSEAVEQRHSRSSSASSLSEVSERAHPEMDGQDFSMSDDRNRNVSQESGISRQTSDMSTLADDLPHKEPVYDSSPPAGSNVRGHDIINSDISDVDERHDESFTDQQTQGEKNLGEIEEEKHLPVSQREYPIPFEAQLEEQPSIDEVENVQSPTSDGDYHEAHEKVSTPIAGGSTSHFYDRSLHDPEYDHLQEVQVPNTPVESTNKVRSIQNIHIPLHELDHDVSRDTKSPSIANVLSEPPAEPASHANTQAILEGAAQEIKENHAGLLSESDSLGEERIFSAEKPPAVPVSHVNTQTILEKVAEEIKENHSGLLSESYSVSEERAVPAEIEKNAEASSTGASAMEQYKHLENSRAENVDEGETHDDIGSSTSDIDNGNSLKSSSSSSSPNSTDSEATKKMVMSAKRRLSTPF